jgi:hypothetical protein
MEPEEAGMAQSVYWLVYGMYDRGSIPGRDKDVFLFSTESRPALRPTQPPIQWEPGTLLLGVKRPVREADHSPPSSTEVKKTWAIPPLPSTSY